MTRYVKVAGKRISASTVVYLIYILFYISGYNGSGHNYIKAAMFFAWNIVAAWEDVKSYQRALFSLPNFFVIGFILLHFFTSIFISKIGYTLEYTAKYFMLYGCLTQFLYYKNRNNIKELKAITVSALAAFFFFSVKAIIFYVQNPSAARVLASNYYAYDTITIGGGYRIAVGAAILLVGVFELMLAGRLTKTANQKLLCLLAVGVFLYLLVKTESTITLIAAVLGLVLATINRASYGKQLRRQVDFKRKVLGALVIVLCVILLLVSVNGIGEMLMRTTEDNMDKLIYRRIYRIGEKMYYFGTENTVTNYVDTRLDTIKTSWNTFLQNPLLGVGYKCGNHFQTLKDYGVGTHSTIFDTLAQFGVVGGILFFSYMLTALKITYQSIRGNAYVVALLLLMVMNPFSYFHGYFVVLVLLPMLGDLCDKRLSEGEVGEST